jgi:hypothetical protein
VTASATPLVISLDSQNQDYLPDLSGPTGNCQKLAAEFRPTAEWQIEIERALFAMDAFLAIHTKGFSQSFWAQQEIGFAVARGVKIISFKMGEDPTGFISKHQALPRGNRSAEDIAKEVNALLSDDDLTAARLRAVIFANKPKPPPKSDFDDEIPF